MANAVEEAVGIMEDKIIFDGKKKIILTRTENLFENLKKMKVGPVERCKVSLLLVQARQLSLASCSGQNMFFR